MCMKREYPAACRFLVFAMVVLCLGGCGGTTTLSTYSGPAYPETAQVEVLFQASQVQPSCRVFAELFAFFPADVSAKTMETVLVGEARVRGAHVLLIGQSRESREEEGLYLLYFGPQREYTMDRGWSDWIGGYGTWKRQGGWIGLGHGEWGREELLFSVPVVVQAALLRCP